MTNYRHRNKWRSPKRMVDLLHYTTQDGKLYLNGQPVITGDIDEKISLGYSQRSKYTTIDKGTMIQHIILEKEIRL
ncbi:MAG: hypothetical protein NC218_08035 [Acetobacter sp.]|nr:hypothetical protein [Acetobacter sp.]